MGLVTVVDVNTRSLIRSGGGFTRDVRQAKPELGKLQSKYGRRIPFASHKPEAPKKKKKKRRGPSVLLVH
jgi:hypothetical protein